MYQRLVKESKSSRATAYLAKVGMMGTIPLPGGEDSDVCDGSAGKVWITTEMIEKLEEAILKATTAEWEDAQGSVRIGNDMRKP